MPGGYGSPTPETQLGGLPTDASTGRGDHCSKERQPDVPPRACFRDAASGRCGGEITHLPFGMGRTAPISVPVTPVWDKVPPPRKTAHGSSGVPGMATAHDTSVAQTLVVEPPSPQAFLRKRNSWKIGTPEFTKTRTLSPRRGLFPTNAGISPTVIGEVRQKLTRAPDPGSQASPRKTSRTRSSLPCCPSLCPAVAP